MHSDHLDVIHRLDLKNLQVAKRSWIGASIEDFIRFGGAHVPAMPGGKKAAELEIRQLLKNC